MKPEPMHDEPKDTLDREIDDALASMVSCEPRRVDAASVRRVMGSSHTAPLPAWFAAAAILLATFGVWMMKDGSVAPTVPVSVARSATRPEPVKVQPSPIPEMLERATTAFPAPSRAKPSAMKHPTEPPYEGLPRIVIATIEKPEPLTAPTLHADALAIAAIDIPTLSVPTLSNGPEQPQEKPQP